MEQLTEMQLVPPTGTIGDVDGEMTWTVAGINPGFGHQASAFEGCLGVDSGHLELLSYCLFVFSQSVRPRIRNSVSRPISKHYTPTHLKDMLKWKLPLLVKGK